ncbi:MAG: hypothetical protein K8S87_01930 [Planctomycetes bacterium]|nr:hypothetical protein [Planctomycetota bacterium]
MPDFIKKNNSDFEEPTENLSKQSNEDNNPNASLQNYADKAHAANKADESFEISIVYGLTQCETRKIKDVKTLSELICQNEWTHHIYEGNYRLSENF